MIQLSRYVFSVGVCLGKSEILTDNGFRKRNPYNLLICHILNFKIPSITTRIKELCLPDYNHSILSSPLLNRVPFPSDL